MEIEYSDIESMIEIETGRQEMEAAIVDASIWIERIIRDIDAGQRVALGLEVQYDN